MKINLSSFLQWRFNVYMCRLLGWKITFYYIIFLGKIYFFFNRKERSKITNAVQAVFSDLKCQSEIKSISRKVFRGILAHYYEKFFNVYSTPETLRNFFETHTSNQGLNAITQGLSKGKGVLLISGHFGGIELIPTFLSNLNYPVTIVVKFKTKDLRGVTRRQAKNFSVKIIDPDHTPNIMKAICDDLRANRIVITQCDEIEEWRPCRHDKIRFLNNPVHLDRTINILSKRCGAAIVFGVMHRTYSHRYKFIATSWEKMAAMFERSGDMSIGEIVLKYMEHYIYNHPEEWYQWKKYPSLEMLSPADSAIAAPPAIPVLEPYFI